MAQRWKVRPCIVHTGGAPCATARRFQSHDHEARQRRQQQDPERQAHGSDLQDIQRRPQGHQEHGADRQAGEEGSPVAEPLVVGREEFAPLQEFHGKWG